MISEHKALKAWSMLPRIFFPAAIFFVLIAFSSVLWLDSARRSDGDILIGRQAPIDHSLVGAGEACAY